MFDTVHRPTALATLGSLVVAVIFFLTGNSLATLIFASLSTVFLVLTLILTRRREKVFRNLPEFTKNRFAVRRSSLPVHDLDAAERDDEDEILYEEAKSKVDKEIAIEKGIARYTLGGSFWSKVGNVFSRRSADSAGDGETFNELISEVESHQSPEKLVTLSTGSEVPFTAGPALGVFHGSPVNRGNSQFRELSGSPVTPGLSLTRNPMSVEFSEETSDGDTLDKQDSEVSDLFSAGTPSGDVDVVPDVEDDDEEEWVPGREGTVRKKRKSAFSSRTNDGESSADSQTTKGKGVMNFSWFKKKSREGGDVTSSQSGEIPSAETPPNPEGTTSWQGTSVPDTATVPKKKRGLFTKRTPEVDIPYGPDKTAINHDEGVPLWLQELDPAHQTDATQTPIPSAPSWGAEPSPLAFTSPEPGSELFGTETDGVTPGTSSLFQPSPTPSPTEEVPNSDLFATPHPDPVQGQPPTTPPTSEVDVTSDEGVPSENFTATPEHHTPTPLTVDGLLQALYTYGFVPPYSTYTPVNVTASPPDLNDEDIPLEHAPRTDDEGTSDNIVSHTPPSADVHHEEVETQPPHDETDDVPTATEESTGRGDEYLIAPTVEPSFAVEETPTAEPPTVTPDVPEDEHDVTGHGNDVTGHGNDVTSTLAEEQEETPHLSTAVENDTGSVPPPTDAPPPRQYRPALSLTATDEDVHTMFERYRHTPTSTLPPEEEPRTTDHITTPSQPTDTNEQEGLRPMTDTGYATPTDHLSDTTPPDNDAPTAEVVPANVPGEPVLVTSSRVATIANQIADLLAEAETTAQTLFEQKKQELEEVAAQEKIDNERKWNEILETVKREALEERRALEQKLENEKATLAEEAEIKIAEVSSALADINAENERVNAEKAKIANQNKDLVRSLEDAEENLDKVIEAQRAATDGATTSAKLQAVSKVRRIRQEAVTHGTPEEVVTMLDEFINDFRRNSTHPQQ